jgi:ATP-dependent Clp protease adapter protein ClpS
MPDTITIIREVVDTSLDRTYSLIAHNDDVTPAQLVAVAFLAIGLDRETAVAKTQEIHNTGSARVKSGMSKEDVTKAYNVVLAITRMNGRFPGIAMDMLEDF